MKQQYSATTTSHCSSTRLGLCVLSLVLLLFLAACSGRQPSNSPNAPAGQGSIPGKEEFGMTREELFTAIEKLERTGEIGANRKHIAAQFLIESASLGIIGGILGSTLGVLIVVAVSAYQVWTPVLDPLAPIAAPLLGGLIGLVSGAYPALRAGA